MVLCFLVKRTWSKLDAMCYAGIRRKEYEDSIVVLPVVFVDTFFPSKVRSSLLGCRELAVGCGVTMSLKKWPLVFRSEIDVCSGRLRGVG